MEKRKTTYVISIEYCSQTIIRLGIENVATEMNSVNSNVSVSVIYDNVYTNQYIKDIHTRKKKKFWESTAIQEWWEKYLKKKIQIQVSTPDSELNSEII